MTPCILLAVNPPSFTGSLVHRSRRSGAVDVQGTVPGTPPPKADGDSIGSGDGTGVAEVSQAPGGGGGSLSVLTAGPSQGNASKTNVAPLLLLRAVPEAVMCQLVLAGWEESSAGGGAVDVAGVGVGDGGGGHSSTSSFAH